MDLSKCAYYLVADVLYDFGTGLEVMSPLCPHLFLEMAGLGNFAKVISFICVVLLLRQVMCLLDRL